LTTCFDALASVVIAARRVGAFVAYLTVILGSSAQGAAAGPATTTPTVSADARPGTGGWTAVQTQTGPAGAAGTSRITYADHRLRIDEGDRSAVLELSSGDVVYIDRAAKRWARVTLEELVKRRDEQLAALNARIDALPEPLREDFRAQLEAQRAADLRGPEIERTDHTDEVSGYACRVHRWSEGDTRGDVCIAEDLPVDLVAFRADVEALQDRLRSVGASRTVQALDFSRLGERGFPVRIRQTVDLGPGQTATSVFSDFAPVRAPDMAPPPEFERVDYETLLRGAGP